MLKGNTRSKRNNNFITIFNFRFYECEHSIVGDPELGPILSSLMVGPCALEFTRLNSDTYWWVSRYHLISNIQWVCLLGLIPLLENLYRDTGCQMKKITRLKLFNSFLLSEFPVFLTLILQQEVPLRRHCQHKL